MKNMLSDILFLTTIINPIALFVYLSPVRNDLGEKDFIKVVFKATVISLIINLFFTFTGESLFTDVLKIDFNSFRIFGGIVLFSISLVSIVQGQKTLITVRGNLDDLASEIALPFMTGVGTISVCVLIGSTRNMFQSTVVNFAAMFITITVMLFLFWMRYHIDSTKLTVAFDKVLGILIRINGFVMGSFGIDMIRSGVFNIVKTYHQ